MDNENEKELPVTAEPAGAEKTNAAAELGKFGSVDALLNAYRALEAEFTRRSQRLRELEAENKAQGMPAQGAPSPERGKEELLKEVLNNEEVRVAVVSEYLKSVSDGKSVPLVTGGAAPAAPRAAPKSVKEAGALAARFFKK